jgi:hypothetical protein
LRDHLRSTHAFGGEHVYRKDTSRRGDFPIQSFDFVSAVYNPFNLRRHLISHPIATLGGSPSRIGSRFATGNSLKRAKELQQILFLRRRQFGATISLGLGRSGESRLMFITDSPRFA